MTTAGDWDQVYADGRSFRPMNQLLLDEVLDGVHRGTALDLGCGRGDLAAELCRRGFDVTGVDLSSYGIEEAQAIAAQSQLSGLRFQQIDLSAGLPEGRFDLITCKLVYAFMQDKATFLSRIKARLDPEHGVFVLMTPVRQPGRVYDSHYESISVLTTDVVAEMSRVFSHWECVNSSYFGINERHSTYVATLSR